MCSKSTKKILAIYYTQSGQLDRIIRSILGPIESAGNVEVTYEELRPIREYPFPWPFLSFLDVFPESICLDPPPLVPVSFDPCVDFDLIVLAYQVWYLAPSLPVTAFLKSPAAKVMEGKPVLTVVNCRDKWIMAQETVKHLIQEAGGILIGNIATSQHGNSFIQLVITLRWLWTGKKGPFWKIFPEAGLSTERIQALQRFGDVIGKALGGDLFAWDPSILAAMGAARVDPELLQQEKVAHKNFRIWGKIVRRFGKQGDPKRLPICLCFALYLLCLILISFPLAIVFKLVINPLRREKLQREADKYERIPGR